MHPCDYECGEEPEEEVGLADVLVDGEVAREAVEPLGGLWGRDDGGQRPRLRDLASLD